MNEKEFMNSYGRQLNQQQQEALRQVEGPVLLLAVPGSGKTTVLVTRLGYMVYCCRIPPENILTLTYTVAATGDMRERFLRIFGADEISSRLEFRTINGICSKIISWYSYQVGKESFELETQDKVINGILSGIYQKLVKDFPSETDLKNIRTAITYIKNMRLDAEAIRKLPKDGDYDLEEIYRHYCAAMRTRKKMDYDDQMIYAFNILRRSPEALNFFRDKYRYICVDEAQDTSKIQHEIIALLAGGHENLFMVGDEDQSIYGFRAAWPEALLNFEQNHPGARVLLMETNYRSVTSIVDACDCFIQGNTQRHAKHMHASRPEEGQIRRIELKGRGAQYTYLEKVAAGMQEMHSEKKTAILYRDNESGLPLVDILDRRHIPFQIRNRELTFFGHRIVQDIRNIMLFAQNPGDTEIFLKVYYKLSSYLNKQKAVEICQLAEKHRMGVLDAGLQMGHLPPYQTQTLKSLVRNLGLLTSDSASTAISRIVGPMGYGEYLQRAEIRDSKIAILRLLAKHEDSIQGFMDRLDQLENLLRSRESDSDSSLILSTIHGSKGLEYDIVYLLDVIDGIFPEKVPSRGNSSSNKKDEEVKVYEEERRLFYVGATRAKDLLHVFPVEGRDCTFIDELLQGSDKRVPGNAPEGRWGRNSAQVSPKLSDPNSRNSSRIPLRLSDQQNRRIPETGSGRQAGEMQKKGKTSGKKQFSEDEFRRFCSDLGEGMPVVHKALGEGVITGMNDTAVTIAFDREEKRFLLEILYMKDLLQY